MGIPFTRIWRLFSRQERKAVMAGLDNAGETTILCQFSMNEVVHTAPTTGSDVEEDARLRMWDTGGQESHCTDAELVLVVDSADPESISVTREDLYEIAHGQLRKAASPVLANKQDAEERMTVAESPVLKLASARGHQWHIQAVLSLVRAGAKDLNG